MNYSKKPRTRRGFWSGSLFLFFQLLPDFFCASTAIVLTPDLYNARSSAGPSATCGFAHVFAP